MVITMDRLTITRRIPKNKNTVMCMPESEAKAIRDKMEHLKVWDIYTRLQDYEDTGLSPADIIEMKSDWSRLKQIMREFDNVLKRW